MTTDTLAAPPQTRPPHIPRAWWYKATWHARQQAIDAHNAHRRANAEAIRQENARIAKLRANVETERRTHMRRYHPGDLDDAEPITEDALDTAGLIETIEAMLDWTDDVNLICRELGKTPGSLEMRLRRAERVDLSRPFQAVRNGQRYKPCPDCGKNISHNSARCRSCAFRAREVKVA